MARQKLIKKSDIKAMHLTCEELEYFAWDIEDINKGETEDIRFSFFDPRCFITPDSNRRSAMKKFVIYTAKNFIKSNGTSQCSFNDCAAHIANIFNAPTSWIKRYIKGILISSHELYAFDQMGQDVIQLG